MAGKQSIFLVGPMGAGKTSIGRRLAQLLDFEFIDTDHEIEARTGATISWIFDVEGEAGFRRREQAVIDELTQRPAVVLGTGGGAVISEVNRQHLQDRGIVVYLRADLDELLARTARDKNRPLLQTDDPRQTLAELVRQRDPWYREVADIVFDTRRQSVGAAAQRLHQLVTSYQQRRGTQNSR
jgi:shikimate kinase